MFVFDDRYHGTSYHVRNAQGTIDGNVNHWQHRENAHSAGMFLSEEPIWGQPGCLARSPATYAGFLNPS